MATLSLTPSSGNWYAYVNIPYTVSYNRETNQTTVTFSQSSASYYGRSGYGTRMDCVIRVTATDSNHTQSTTLTTYGYTAGDSQSTFYGTPSPVSVTVTHSGTGTKQVTILASCNIYVYMYSSSTSQTVVGGSGSVTVTAGSRFILSMNQGAGSIITVTRAGSQLSDGALLSAGESLVVNFLADTGYTLDTHTINNTTFTPGDTYSVTGNVVVVSTASAITYLLSIVQGSNTSVRINRTSSPYGGGAEGYIGNGATIYYGDNLSITYSISTGYTVETHTVNGTTFSSGDDYTVSSDIVVTVTAVLNMYSITSTIGEHISLIIRRIASPLGGAPSGVISNDGMVYHGDELTVTAVPNSGYGIESLTVNGAVVSSPHRIAAVSSPLVIAVLAAASGFIYIDSGAAIEKYKILIDSGSILEQYRAMIDTGSAIVPY